MDKNGIGIKIPKYSEDSLREKKKDEQVSSRYGYTKNYADRYDKIFKKKKEQK